MTVQLWCVIVDDLENTLSNLYLWLQNHLNRRLIYTHPNAFVLDISSTEAQELKRCAWVMDVVPELAYYMDFRHY